MPALSVWPIEWLGSIWISKCKLLFLNKRSYESFPVVKVKFQSGSEVSFALGYSGDLENVRFHKKYDAVSESTEALMERFNNQPAKQ